MRTLIIVMLFGVLTAVSFAEVAQHAHKHDMTPAMKKQHKAMTDAARLWAEAKGSLESGDLQKAKNKVDAVITAIRDMQDFMLHRNADKREEFRKECELFRDDLRKLKDALAEKNAEIAKSHAAAVDKACSRCHARFK